RLRCSSSSNALFFPMKMSFASCFVLSTLGASIVGAFSLPAADSDWPRWRGPQANGTAPGAKPPTTWSETEHVKWKTKLPGFGTSTPIIWKDQVFILTAIPTGKKVEAAEPPPESEPANASDQQGRRRGGSGGRSENPTEIYQWVILALNRTTGKTAWQKVAREEVPHEGHHRDHGFASASPVTDGEHLYAFFGSRGLYCYDLQGNKKWEKDFGDMQTRNSFGEGASPALHGDTLVITWDHEGDDFVVALDKRTGRELWRKERDEPTSWATPLIVEHDGTAQAVVSATNKIRSYDLADGKVVWECGGMTTNVIPTPVTGFDNVYVLSGFRGAALLAIELGQKGDLTGGKAIAWQHGKGTPYVPSPLLSGERLYFYSGNNGILSCFNARSGEPFYETERIADLSGGVYASPIAADGKVYLVGRDGKSVVIKDAPTLEPIATNELDDRFDASPAAVAGELFLRGHEFLYCLAE
ncbi:MAG: PQQ-binding-like beta-propeller repeat protein, partial [Chthoniobacteraceae bacterium]